MQTARAREAVRHNWFRRLYRIQQLGTRRAYSRAVHSLGTASNAYRIACALRLGPVLSEVLEVAGLLHDVGHARASHSFDHVLLQKGLGDCLHEQRSQQIVRFIGEDLRWPDGFIGQVQSLIAARPHAETPAELQFVINSPDENMDADRLDYLARDARLFGVCMDLRRPIAGMIQESRIEAGRWTCGTREQQRYLWSLRELLFKRHYRLIPAPKFTDEELCAARLQTRSDCERFWKITDD